MNSTTTKIFDPSDLEIGTRIVRIEQNIPNLDLSQGIPIPFWDSVESIEQVMTQLNVPGISVAVINNFQVKWTKCYGIKDRRTKENVSIETLFEVGSASKTLTGITILKLVEQGTLALDVPVTQYLKSWSLPENQYTKENPVTLRHLLAHTAGINRPDSMFTKETDSIPSINQILNGESPATNDPVEIMFTPGSDHNYSNLGYIIIQKIIVDVLGKPFAQIIKELIFDPLGLQSSTFEYPEGDIAKNLSAPHDQEGKAHPPGLMHGASGHGGFLTNPAEFGLILLDLMKSYHDKPHKILSSETVHSMLTSQYTINPAQFFGWTGQGLGTFLIEENNQLFFTHPGTNAPGSTCMILCDVKQGKGVVLMANSINGELLNLRLLYALVKEYKWPKIWLFKNF